MSLKYGDAVVLVKKSPDGSLTRVNAIVLSSQNRVPTTLDRKAIKGAGSEEHLDVMFPRIYPDGYLQKSRDADAIFQPAYDVGPYREGVNIGWEPKSKGLLERIADLTVGKQNLQRDLEKLTAKSKGLLERIADLTVGKQNLQRDLEKLTAKKNGGKTPSAADLDANAAEEKAKQETSGS